VIAVGGSYGTIAEMALALRLGRCVVALAGAPSVEGTIAARSSVEAVDIALRDLG
jgi:SLOG cluster4 family